MMAVYIAAEACSSFDKPNMRVISLHRLSSAAEVGVPMANAALTRANAFRRHIFTVYITTTPASEEAAPFMKALS